jgi:glycosyltransferase involved in cell wall biosynthesis
MVPFAANIINAVLVSQNIDAYALVVSRKELDYRSYINAMKDSHVEFWDRPSKLYGKFIEKFYNYKLLHRIQAIVHKHNIEYIHFLTGDYTLHPFFTKLRKKTTIVYTVHDLVPHETKHKKLKHKCFEKYISWGTKRNIDHADILVTCSKKQFLILKEKFPSKLIYFHQFPSLITENILLGNDYCPELKNICKYILFFGNVQKYKGVEVLYHTFLNNKIFHSNYSLIIAGKGDWYFSRNENETNVIRINRFVKDSEIKSLFCNASCVVYPYLSATQSGVLTLAYKFGVPLVVSDIAYFQDNAENYQTAIFFKKQDENDLTNKLKEILFDIDVDEMKNIQRNYYDRHYSVNSMLKEVEAIYR